MPIKSVDELYLNMLKHMYDAEKQIARALPKMAKKAQSEDLSEAFTDHLDQTKGQIERLERVFEMLDQKPAGKANKTMRALLDEAEEMFGKADERVLDACMIACAQQVEHYEIASYGTLCAMARQLEHDDQDELLHETLEEEKSTDEKLTEIAEDHANEGAQEYDEQEEDEAA